MFLNVSHSSLLRVLSIYFGFSRVGISILFWILLQFVLIWIANLFELPAEFYSLFLCFLPTLLIYQPHWQYLLIFLSLLNLDQSFLLYFGLTWIAYLFELPSEFHS